MYDIDFKNLRKGYSFGAVFFLAGLFFFIIMAFVTFGGMVRKFTMDSSVKATGIDDNCRYDNDGVYMCSPIFHYIVDGVSYTCSISGSSSVRVDKNKNTVYYDSANPRNCVTDYTVKPEWYLYLLCAFPLIFVAVGFNHIKKTYISIKKAKHLATYGTLIKNLPYKMVPTNISVNDSTLYAISVDYTFPNGSTITLTGEPRYDRKQYDDDRLADLLIDPTDLNNYYIDFNISNKI